MSYTEADVDLVAAALSGSNVKRWESKLPVPAWCDLATAALDALSAAGRLAPLDVRTDYGVFQTGPAGSPAGGQALIDVHEGREAADAFVNDMNAGDHPYRFEVRQRQAWDGPWTPVPAPEGATP